MHFIIIGLSFEAGSFPEPGVRLEASNTQDCVSVHHSLGHRHVVFVGSVIQTQQVPINHCLSLWLSCFFSLFFPSLFPPSLPSFFDVESQCVALADLQLAV